MVAYSNSQEKCAALLPWASSSSREYLVRKNTWKTRSSESGPKYRKVVRSRQYYEYVSGVGNDGTK